MIRFKADDHDLSVLTMVSINFGCAMAPMTIFGKWGLGLDVCLIAQGYETSFEIK